MGSGLGGLAGRGRGVAMRGAVRSDSARDKIFSLGAEGRSLPRQGGNIGWAGVGLCWVGQCGVGGVGGVRGCGGSGGMV